MIALDLLVGTYHTVGDRLYRVVEYRVLDGSVALPEEYAGSWSQTQEGADRPPCILLRLSIVERSGESS